jgi:hypothetical protein
MPVLGWLYTDSIVCMRVSVTHYTCFHNVGYKKNPNFMQPLIKVNKCSGRCIVYMRVSVTKYACFINIAYILRSLMRVSVTKYACFDNIGYTNPELLSCQTLHEHVIFLKSTTNLNPVPPLAQTSATPSCSMMTSMSRLKLFSLSCYIT